MEQETEMIIEPSRALSLNLRELWQYRELFYFIESRMRFAGCGGGFALF